MKAKAGLVLLSGVLFGCVPSAPSAPPPPLVPTAAAAPAPAPTAALPAREHRLVAVRNVSCGALLAAAEDDRAAASMFFIGYTTARRGLARIDIGELDRLEGAALAYCEAFPDRPAATAFVKAFRDSGY